MFLPFRTNGTTLVLEITDPANVEHDIEALFNRIGPASPVECVVSDDICAHFDNIPDSRVVVEGASSAARWPPYKVSQMRHVFLRRQMILRPCFTSMDPGY